MKTAQLHDGNVLHFDDDTPDEEIDQHVQEILRDAEQKSNEGKGRTGQTEHAENMQVSLHLLVLMGELIKVGRETNTLLKTLISDQRTHHRKSLDHGDKVIKAIKSPRIAVRDKHDRVVGSETRNDKS